MQIKDNDPAGKAFKNPSPEDSSAAKDAQQEPHEEPGGPKQADHEDQQPLLKNGSSDRKDRSSTSQPESNDENALNQPVPGQDGEERAKE